MLLFNAALCTNCSLGTGEEKLFWHTESKICVVKSVQINLRLNTLNYLSGILNRMCLQAKLLKIAISKRLSVCSSGKSDRHFIPLEQFFNLVSIPIRDCFDFTFAA